MRATTAVGRTGGRGKRTWAAGLCSLALTALPAFVGGCGDGGCDCFSSPIVFAVTTAGDLISFPTFDPGDVFDSGPITGLQPAESLVGIDFRPSDGRLYGVGDTARLYTIDRFTGAATEVGVGPFGALLGTSFGMDFSPVADVIRLVSDADQNLRLDPDSGLLIATDTNLAYDAADPAFGDNPGVVALAYTNDVGGAASTTLFGIDADLDTVVRIGSLDGSPVSPNAGTLFTVGSLGLNAGTLVGFDIRTSGGVDRAYAVMTTAGSPKSLFFGIGLITGHATFLGEIASTDLVTAMAVRPP